MTVGSLFAGIGGLDLGLERAGFAVRWQVEIDPYCRAVLAKHWPDVPRFDDIRALDPTRLEPVDLICGGFPCQPVSLAGKKRAQRDTRWLWPEFARIVRHLRPIYVCVENVPGLRVRGMGDVLGELAALGYDAEWESLPAIAFGAPHIRDRVFIVAAQGPAAHAIGSILRLERERLGEQRGLPRPPEPRDDGPHRHLADPDRRGLEVERLSEPPQGDEGLWAPLRDAHAWSFEPDVGRVAHGVPSRVDRLRAIGNSVVPQVAEFVGRAIMNAQKP